MAKIVIAGKADCPYFAKIELLADGLVKNLPNFELHKIVKQSTDWQDWLASTCKKNGWSHNKSPIVWRELVDRGGKGLLIGGANEFQQYAQGYYNIKSTFASEDMKKISSENQETKDEIDEEERQFKERIKPISVCITNASSPICYAMMEGLAKGEGLGSSTDISIRLFDTPENQEILEGVEMEAFDLACPLLRKLTVTSDPCTAFSDCSLIILLDEIEKNEDESKADWLKRNNDCFMKYAELINANAKKDIKIIVGGTGPVNFNTYMLLQHLPNIPRQNIVAVSRVIENSAKAILAERLKVNSAGLVNVTVWGHSSDKYFLDVSQARVHNYDGAIWGPPSFSLPVGEMVHDDKWMQKEFLEMVEKRREMIEQSLTQRASASIATSIVTLVNQWWNGSPVGQTLSLGVQSEGWYGVPDGLVFSFPVIFNPEGYWTVVQDIDLSEESKDKIQDVIKDLNTEIEVIYPPPYVPSPTPEHETEATQEQNSGQATPTPIDDDTALGRITEDQEGEEEAATETHGRKGSTASEGKDSPKGDGSEKANSVVNGEEPEDKD